MFKALMKGALSDSGVIPTDDTETYSLDATFDENRYALNSLLHQRPNDKNIIVHTFTDGTAHVTDAGKKIVFRKSTDRGVSWGSKTTLYDPTDGTFQVQDPGIGYDRRGRLHIMADCHSNFASTGQSHELRYMYSDDDGTTVSSPTTITLPSNGLATFRMYGRIIDVSGVLLAPAYFQTEEGNTTNSARYALRSTDGGANWTWILIETTSTYINETEFLAIDSNVVIAVSRHEVLKQFYMYKSLDRGATWAVIGVLGTTITMTVAAPCRLHKWKLDDGTYAIAMYFVKKTSTYTLYAMYGRLDVGIEAGLGIFKSSTVTTLATNANIIHYGDVCHYNGNMNAKAVYSREVNFPTDNELVYLELPATHYSTVEGLISPVTIYDRLAQPEFIGTYRGLVSNTTNDYGVVNGSSQVTTLKSIAPGPTGRNFTATAGGIVLSGSGMDFDGTKALANASSATWNFLHYSGAGAADVNYTIWFCGKFGTSSNPNAGYGFIGNNGASAANRGMCSLYDDRASVPRNNALVFYISKGSAGFIIEFVNADLITPNTKFVMCIEVDLSQSAQNDKVKVYLNGVLQSTTVTTYNSTINNLDSTYSLQIGAAGNSVLPFIGTICDVVIQNAIDIASVRDNFTDALMSLEDIT
jgi:hypothetical protein